MNDWLTKILGDGGQMNHRIVVSRCSLKGGSLKNHSVSVNLPEVETEKMLVQVISQV